MKLKDWADKQGIAYLTAYRWFRDGKLPVKAYQTESGTIIVEAEPDNVEKPMASNSQTSDIMSIFLKKTVEFSKNNTSVEDFAAYILSNFSLKLNSGPDTPKYSRNKPKPEDIQKHFQQFLKPKGEKPKPNMFVAEPEALDELMAESDNMTTQELVSEIQKIGGYEITNKLPTILQNGVSSFVNTSQVPEMQDLIKDLSAALSPTSLSLTDSVKTYDSLANTEGVVVRNVDLTPQSINYTSSTNSAFGIASISPLTITANSVSAVMPASAPTSSYVMATSVFQPTPKEIEKAHEAFSKVASDLRATVTKARRGRKPSKKTGKK